MKIIVFDPGKCSGCGACQAVCSFVKTGKIQLSASRIKIKADEEGMPLYAGVCQHCAKPACLTACMKGIIHKDAETGFVKREASGCIECAACLALCPVGAVVHSKEEEAFLSCDLCGGEPACLKACSSGALMYADPAQASFVLRNNYAQRALGGKTALEALYKEVGADD